jgi:hypothetical protein
MSKHIGTCIDCKFWNRNGQPYEIYCDENDYNGEEVPHRRCLSIIHGNEGGAHSKMKSASAAVLDGSGYAASLWTMPDFGCTSFEAETSK